MSIKINLDLFKKNLRKYVVKNEFPKLLKEATSKALPKIRLEFKKSYRRTDFSKGLRGQYPFDFDKDVQAILGFYPTEVNDIDEKIAQILGDSLKFSKFVSRNSAVYFHLTSENIKDYLKNNYPDETYESDNGTVDWLNWVLFGGQVNANIIIKAFPDTRSGRAIMGSINKGSWSAEDYDIFPSSPSGGFIQEMLEDEEFISNASFIIADKFQEITK